VLIVNLVSPDSSVDPVALSNYAYLQGWTRETGFPGVGDVQIFVSGATRCASGLIPTSSPTRYHRGRRAAGGGRTERPGCRRQDRAVPAPEGTPFEMQVKCHRRSHPEQFGDIVVPL